MVTEDEAFFRLRNDLEMQKEELEKLKERLTEVRLTTQSSNTETSLLTRAFILVTIPNPWQEEHKSEEAAAELADEKETREKDMSDFEDTRKELEAKCEDLQSQLHEAGESVRE